MKNRKYLFLGVVLWFVWGCSNVDYTQQYSAYIVLKTPHLKYADMGFIYENSQRLKVEIYSNGQVVTALKIGKDSVCMGTMSCLSKKAFTRRFLSLEYPDEMIGQIFRGEAIFGGRNKIQKRNGFTQKCIKHGKYHIEYTVFNKQILFRDTINKILIKVIRQ